MGSVSERGTGSAARRMMTHRALVLEPVDIGTDEYGHQQPASHDNDYATRYEAMPCRAWVDTVQADQLDAETQAAVEVIKVACPLGYTLDTSMILSGIGNRLGVEWYTGTLRITGVSSRATHTLLTCKRITGGVA